MRITDENYYPYLFKRFKVINQDVNGNPTETVFYSDNAAQRPVFRWLQTWNAFDKCTDWQIKIIRQ